RPAPPDVRAHAGPGMARHAPQVRAASRSTGDMTETPADEERAPEHTPDPVPEPPVAEAPEPDAPQPQEQEAPATGSAAEAAPAQDPAATAGAPDESATES